MLFWTSKTSNLFFPKRPEVYKSVKKLPKTIFFIKNKFFTKKLCSSKNFYHDILVHYCQKCSKLVQNYHYLAKSVQKLPKAFKSVQKRQRASKSFQKQPNASKKVQNGHTKNKHWKRSEMVQNCPKVIKTKISPRMKYYQNWNVTKSEISLRQKCFQNIKKN